MSLPVDYYAILDVPRDAPHLQILQSYRRLSLQWHPQKHPEGQSPSVLTHFERLSEAYDVLTKPELRAVFDYYGEKGLKAGVTLHTGQTSSPYTLSTTPLDLFESVWGQSSPYSAVLSYNTASALQDSNPPAKPAPLIVKLFVSLEELYHGCQKKVKVARKRLTSPPSTTATSTTPASPTSPVTFVLDERALSLNVIAGYRAGTKITFEGEGDESEGGVKGDVQFVVCERPHPRLSRVKDDLVWVCEMGLVDALCGSVVGVEMLDDRVLSVGLSEVCTPKGVKRVQGEGMPKVGGGKGDLLIQYDIRFPEQLTLAQKDQLRQVLQ